jgi:hypothetical protein
VTTRWSLGVFGDLVWDLLPEARPFIQEMIGEFVESAVLCERPIEQPVLADFVGPIVRSCVEPIERGEEEPGAVGRLADLLRAIITHDGPERGVLHLQLGVYIIETLDTDALVGRMTEEAPDVVALVRQHFPSDWGADRPIV